MKRVIDGKLYNTETAQLLCEWDNGVYGNDFTRCEESLYRTKRGAFFISGSGGPMSKWSVVHSSTTSGSCGIELLTKQEAMLWLEEHDGSVVLEEEFKDEIEEG